MRIGAVLGGAVFAALALGGCSTTGAPGPSVAALPEPAAAAPPPPPVNYGGFLGGAVGAKLPDADRDVALAAEVGALSSGERRTWKGERGVFGYVVPGPSNPGTPTAEGATAECRSFTATVFFAGRPTSGHGVGCRGVDGAWRVTS